MILLVFLAQVSAKFIFGCSVNLNETGIIEEELNGNLDFAKCTHIKIGTALLGQDSVSLDLKYAEQVELLRSLLTRLKKKYTAKILLQLELTNDAIRLKKLLHTPNLVNSFAENVDLTLKELGFDGIELVIRRLPILSSFNQLLGILRKTLKRKIITVAAQDEVSMNTYRPIDGIPDEFIPPKYRDMLGNFSPGLCNAVDFFFINLFYSPGKGLCKIRRIKRLPSLPFGTVQIHKWRHN